MQKRTFQVPALWRERLERCNISSSLETTVPVVYGLEHQGVATSTGNRAGMPMTAGARFHLRANPLINEPSSTPQEELWDDSLRTNVNSPLATAREDKNELSINSNAAHGPSALCR